MVSVYKRGTALGRRGKSGWSTRRGVPVAAGCGTLAAPEGESFEGSLYTI
jgi:hypothetical protein